MAEDKPDEVPAGATAAGGDVSINWCISSPIWPCYTVRYHSVQLRYAVLCVILYMIGCINLCVHVTVAIWNAFTFLTESLLLLSLCVCPVWCLFSRQVLWVHVYMYVLWDGLGNEIILKCKLS